MLENRITIIINRSVEDVFQFTLNPKNTSKWINGIKQEESYEWPPKVGTIYRNESKDGVWRQYKLTELQSNDSFTLKSSEGNYSVRYTFKEDSDKTTEFEYFEWVESGVLDDPFTLDTLQKLKEVMEQPN
jgi:uncharacterized protein YndB with AHSA1/START domain